MVAARLTAVAALLLSLGGCALPTALPNATGAGIPAGSMVVVGKIELDPPFSPELEQTTHWNILGDGAIRNRVLLATGSESRPVQPGVFSGNTWQGYIDAYWGEYFAVIMPRAPRYLNGVAVPLDVRQQEYLWFPGSLVIRPPEDGDVLYVGTLKYVRDDFNQIVDIQIVDERQEAAAFLSDAFGPKRLDFRTALWLRQLPWETGELQ